MTKIKRWFCLLFLVLLPAQALANVPTSVDYNAVYYNNTTRCKVTIATNLIGSDNIEKAFRYFVAKGLTDTQSAAFIGNFRQESGVDPNADQPDGPGRGIAQWSQDERWQDLLLFAQQSGKNPRDLSLQLDFVWHELENSFAPVLTKVKATSDLATAVKIIVNDYEIAGDVQMANRVKYAQETLALYGGSSSAASPSVAAPAGGCASISGPSQNSQYIDGFLVYSQNDPAWKDNPYGTSNIGAAGCGPAAMAMIITALTGTSVTPADTAKYADEQNQYQDGVGSKWTIAPVLADHWGLKATLIGKDPAKIAATLQTGGLVIGSGQGPLPFTSAGHYIVVRGVTADGKFKIGDSAHSDTSSQDWDPQQLTSTMNDGSVYAITK